MLAAPAQAQSRAQLDSWWRICADRNALDDDRIRNCTNYIDARTATPANRAAAHFFRGTVYHGMDDLDRAIRDYNDAIQLNPKLDLAYNARGIAWRESGDLDNALADFNQAILINPRNPDFLTNRCFVYAISGRNLFQGLGDCNESLRQRPQHLELSIIEA